VSDGAYKATESIVNEWSEKLKLLLETKHLYQSVVVDVLKAKQLIVNEIVPGIAAHVDAGVDPWLRRPLEGAMVIVKENVMIGNQTVNVVKPELLVSNVKLFCGVCKSCEVYYPLWIRDVTPECKDPRNNPMPRKDSFQLFFLAFQCQNCHSEPEGFIVRRSGYKLHLEGRSPIEEVVVPRYLPKKESRYFSDAVVAFDSGKKLAGLFYLRTFLEQFGRRITGMYGRFTGDQILETYGGTLPAAHRDHMPSFRSLYDKLSDALHQAREDDDLFEFAKAEIDRHFDIRRVFNIPEVEHTLDPIDSADLTAASSAANEPPSAAQQNSGI